jgi:predicted transglutaminase-like cysteine proteinase
MFGRIAACGIAVFVLVSLALFSGETKAFTDVDAPAAAVMVATSRHHVHDQIQNLAPDSTVDAQARTKVSALEPVVQSIKPTVAVGPAIQSPAMTEPFGLNTVPVAGDEVLSKWNGVKADIRAENDILSRCRANTELCPAAARKFLAIVAQGRAQTGRARIGIINRAINLAIRPMSDLAQWGVIDRWSAPLVTLATGRGDCEDYAIAKYVALKEAGVAAEDLRLVIVRDLAVGGDHAVVVARLDGDWIVLDNRKLTLVEDSQSRQMVPLFVLDQTGVRQFARPTTPDRRPAWAAGEGAEVAPGSL